MATKIGGSAWIVMADLFSLLTATMLGLNHLKGIEANSREKALPAMRLAQASSQRTGDIPTSQAVLPLSLQKHGDQIVYLLEDIEIERTQLASEIKKRHASTILIRADQDIVMPFENLTRLYADISAAGVRQISYAVKTTGAH